MPILQNIKVNGLAYGGNHGGVTDNTRLDIALMEAMQNGNFEPWNHVFKVSPEYWLRKMGADHIIVMPSPISRHSGRGGRARKLSHYLLQLHRPIFLTTESSRSFIKEYGPSCAKKNLVMPFPNLDPKFYGVDPWRVSIKRSKLVMYQSGKPGSCLLIREALNEVTRNTSISKQMRAQQRYVGYRMHTFCGAPVGENPSSKRQYEMMLFGCIPLLLGDDMVYAFTQEAGGETPSNEFIVQLPQKALQIKAEKLNHQNVFPLDGSISPKLGTLPGGTALQNLLIQIVHKELGQKNVPIIHAFDFEDGRRPKFPWPNVVPEILARVPREEIMKLQQGVAKHASRYRYYQTFRENPRKMLDFPIATQRMPDGGAIDELVKYLSMRKAEGVSTAADQCDVSRGKPHEIRDPHPCVAYLDGLPETQEHVYKPGASGNIKIDVLGNVKQEASEQDTLISRRMLTTVNLGADEFLSYPGRSPWTVHSCGHCIEKR